MEKEEELKKEPLFKGVPPGQDRLAYYTEQKNICDLAM